MTSFSLPIKPIVDPATAFAFVLGVLFNQQLRAEQAWQAPHRLADRIGGITPNHLLALGAEVFTETFARPPAIHPFRNAMAGKAFAAAELVAAEYCGDARRVWADTTAQDCVRRLRDFDGIGERKAHVAVFVLTRQLGVRMSGQAESFSIQGCTKLVELFHPHHEPLLT